MLKRNFSSSSRKCYTLLFLNFLSWSSLSKSFQITLKNRNPNLFVSIIFVIKWDKRIYFMIFYCVLHHVIYILSYLTISIFIPLTCSILLNAIYYYTYNKRNIVINSSIMIKLFLCNLVNFAIVWNMKHVDKCIGPHL